MDKDTKILIGVAIAGGMLLTAVPDLEERFNATFWWIPLAILVLMFVVAPIFLLVKWVAERLGKDREP